jgi:hypothetical protein
MRPTYLRHLVEVWIILRDLQQHHALPGAELVEMQSDHIVCLRPSCLLEFVTTRSPATSRRPVAAENQSESRGRSRLACCTEDRCLAQLLPAAGSTLSSSASSVDLPRPLADHVQQRSDHNTVGTTQVASPSTSTIVHYNSATCCLAAPIASTTSCVQDQQLFRPSTTHHRLSTTHHRPLRRLEPATSTFATLTP